MRRRDALPDPEVVHGLRELDSALAGEPAADPELTQLVADVAAERPEPSAAFLASLDARVHAGFPREGADGGSARRRAPWLARLRTPQVLLPGFAAVLVALVVGIGLSSDNSEPLSGSLGGGDSASSSSSGRGTTEMSATAESAPDDADAAGKSAPSTALAAPAPASGAAGAADSAAQPRRVERAAELTLTPKPDDVQETADGVIRETQAAGGYVQSSSISTRDGAGEATFALRIPTARLDATLARLSKLAHVGALNQSATDITAQTATAAERLADTRAERRALLKALGRATTERQIASLKARLRDNRAELAQRQGALDMERRRADLATVAVNVQGTASAGDDAEEGGAWTPGDALHDAGRVLEVAGGVALVALAVLAPLAVLAALALLAARPVRRHRREAALDRSA
ncbi:MAG TPA: DUF4349 domain-containing protein [Baekduia sp.]|nr:DUF4349 domain-containing protein [Baekduia sp.]